MRSRLFGRRPSASMVVALLALFVALGGVGYAAVAVPPGSVGTAQLRNGAVTNSKIANGAVGNHKLKPGAVGPRKIRDGAVGLAQINPAEVQARISGSCPSTTAIASVDATGAVGCVSALPQEWSIAPGTTAVTLTAGAAPPTLVASKQLSGTTPFLAIADPYATIAGGSTDQSVEVDCTLAVSTDKTTRTRSLIVEAGPSPATVTGAIPIVLAAQGGANPVATVTCSEAAGPTGSPPPTVTVNSGIAAIQIQSAS